ncbi:MAG TPA: low molecular weight protein arginine phosphatase [Longimicrobiaceae bacterium]|nr:low molecular weight protein arginine phosphatase [Longimicrobiaceae bacterium]
MPEKSVKRPELTTFNILFVCTGNTCRSPMAEAIARREISRRGWQNVRVASAGASAEPGRPAAAEAITVLAREGIDLSDHSSRPLSRDIVEWSDLILAMGPSHLTSIARWGGAAKAALLGDFAAGESMPGSPVPDPFGAEETVYLETAVELHSLIRSALDRLDPILGS